MEAKNEDKKKNLLRSLGPGLVTGASDDDPSGIATYSQAGAEFGLGAAWTALFTLPFMIAVQEMCGRIGLVKGKGLATVMKERYGTPILAFAVALLAVANVVNIGADLGAMASVLAGLSHIAPFVWLFLVAGCTVMLEVFVPYASYAKYLKYLTISLLAYVASAFVVTHSWGAVALSAVIPRFANGKEYLMVLLAILGTTISPYLFFWQASEEVEEEVEAHKMRVMDHGNPHATGADIRAMRFDTVVGMIASNVIMFFIIVTAAQTLFPAGITAVQTANDAAIALRPLAGEFTFLLFSLGIVGTGLLAIPVLAGSASYAASELFGWRTGLYRRPRRAPQFYGVIATSTLLGLAMNFWEHVPAFRMLYYAAIINAVAAPLILVLILGIANDPKIMGRRVNGRLSNFLGAATALAMGAASVAFLYLEFVAH